ncbi:MULTISPECIES: accessory gene regulator AgrB [Staphylococcus]|nr:MULTISPECIES: accessory gene regulator AgrB [Staphylococcus]KIJ87059.1 accessory gene regulator AgrB [Staphylococcus saprophyticus]MBF2753320.1 accessory gene regulator AgrB [Staphylococcus saprophyticus]MBF2780103.1 accessory gene regulator AgrB [Staphylococcus saprophyticus]MBF2781581.1 accessory gene regulator AgrB [Staphylococcus saprophyticus]MBN6090982.1 accessory gene regulator AgrB [Staphylococcus saprophyticus]
MVKFIDAKIDNFAKQLQQRNNLDRIEYLKMRLGMQVVVNNFFKTIVIYGVSLLCHMFLYTLTVHLTFFLIRHFAHGAHAKNSLLCYIQSVIYFVLLPWIVGYVQVSSLIMYTLALVGLIIISIYAPSATKKQPIPERLRRGKKIKAICLTLIFLLISLFLNEPYQQLMLLGIVIISILQFPIFFPKEDY